MARYRSVLLTIVAAPACAAYAAPPATPTCRRHFFWPFDQKSRCHASEPFEARVRRRSVGGGRAQPRLHSLRGGTATASLALPALQPEVVKSSLKAVSELLTCCGLGVLATKVGLLDAPTTRSLAKCVYNVFLPAMLTTSVASTVAAGAGWSLCPLPLAAWLQVVLGLVLAAALLGPRMLDTPAGRDVAALSSFGNSGVLPLIFADCLFRHHPALHARANALVAMFLLGWSPLFWTLGFSLLSARASPAPPGEPAGAPQDGFWVTLRRRVLTPPIIGCLAGIAVGALPPLRALFVPPATLLPFHRCLEIFGKAYSPAALLVLASSLAMPPPSAAADDDHAHGGAPPRPVRDLGVVMLVRFLLLPLSFGGLLTLSGRAGLLPHDPLRDFILTMQATMPSAQNAVLALQVAGEPTRATRMARMLLVIYLAAALPVALVLSVALQSSGLLAAA